MSDGASKSTNGSKKLRSYALGEWVEGTGKPTELFHAVTGEKVAEANSDGLDFKAMLEYGRRKGGSKLRKMTFHERAALLKQMAKYLMDRKEEFYQASAATGATKADCWVDVDGGIGTFFAYSSKGRREFPNETFHVEGAVEGLFRTLVQNLKVSTPELMDRLWQVLQPKESDSNGGRSLGGEDDELA